MGEIVNSSKCAGFTLIEFCIAVLIMMVGLLGLLQTVNTVTMHNFANILRAEAVVLADEKVIETRKGVFDRASFDALANSAVLVTDRKLRGAFCNYSANSAFRAIGCNSKELTMRVTWRYKGTKQVHNISTVVSSPVLVTSCP